MVGSGGPGILEVMAASPETKIDAKKEGRAIRLGSLDEAFQRYRTPTVNQALIRRIAERAGASSLVGYRTYFRMERSSGGPALEVHPGYTNGFRSESDAARLAGDAERWSSRRFHGAWGVTHPEKGAEPVVATPARRSSAAPRAPRAARQPERVAAVCPTCFMELPATGVCAVCD